MTRNLWLSAGAALLLVAVSAAAWAARIEYLPSGLMFVAALIVLGFAMSAEDVLLKRYDTPHDDDAHPPPLVAFRAARATVLVAMIVVAVAMLF